MTGAVIAQLIIALGPVFLQTIPKLAEVWNTELTLEQINGFCNLAQKSYDQYITEAKARFGQ